VVFGVGNKRGIVRIATRIRVGQRICASRILLTR
jgi:hypothetical protein